VRDETFPEICLMKLNGLKADATPGHAGRRELAAGLVRRGSRVFVAQAAAHATISKLPRYLPRQTKRRAKL
jgi:hypothetical protein